MVYLIEHCGNVGKVRGGSNHDCRRWKSRGWKSSWWLLGL
jgi:hypothetical protein